MWIVGVMLKAICDVISRVSPIFVLYLFICLQVQQQIDYNLCICSGRMLNCTHSTHMYIHMYVYTTWLETLFWWSYVCSCFVLLLLSLDLVLRDGRKVSRQPMRRLFWFQAHVHPETSDVYALLWLIL